MSPAERPVRVLVVDDSELFREMLSGVVAAGRGFELTAVARNGDEAAGMALAHRPDVITMDLNMPQADGFAGIARIMAETPTPILVLTANPTEAAGFKALSLGALDIMEKPRADADLGEYGRSLRTRLRLLAGVKVIRHPRGLREKKVAPAPQDAVPPNLVVMGASLGGPRALATILKRLPVSFPLPIVIVQHIADGFTEGLAGWLDQETDLRVSEAAHGDPLRPGRVLLAPSGRHLLVTRGHAVLSDEPPVDTFRPSVTPLFASAALHYGRRVCGVLLTGMGRDGADGLKAIKDQGGTTLVQDEATSVVFGMPRAAIELGAADRILALEEIPRVLQELVR